MNTIVVSNGFTLPTMSQNLRVGENNFLQFSKSQRSELQLNVTLSETPEHQVASLKAKLEVCRAEITELPNFVTAGSKIFDKSFVNITFAEYF